MIKRTRSCLHLVDLEVNCIVGILDEERVRPQRLIFNATLHADFEGVREGQEEVLDGVDYGAFAAFLERGAVEGQFGLLEELLDVLGRASFERFPQLMGLVLKASKPDILANCARVGAEVELWRQ